MLTYHFNKDKKLVNVESTNEYTPCNLLHVPNEVRSAYKDYYETRKILEKELGEVKIIYNVNAPEGEKAFIGSHCDCTPNETTGWIELGSIGLCNICGGVVAKEEEFYIECRINISASSYDVCFNRVETIRQNSNLCDGYSNDYTKDDQYNYFEVVMTACYDFEKEAVKELKYLSERYKWFFIGEVLDQDGQNIFCDLYE